MGIHQLRRRPAGRTVGWPGGSVVKPAGAAVLAVLAVSVSVLAGCTGSPGRPAITTKSGAASTSKVTSASTPSPTNGATGTVTLAGLPTTPPGRQMRWVLQTLAQTSGPSVADIDAHLSPRFLSVVPPARLLTIIGHTRALGPLRLQSFLAITATSGQAAATERNGARLLIDLVTDTTGRIVGLSLKRGPELPQVSTPEQLQQALTKLGVTATVLLARPGAATTCTPLQALGDQGPRPLGSMFKLYVLGAVVRAIQAGRLHWDSRLTISATAKSLPSGTLQNEPDGTVVTVQQAASLMISISDNTAADLLIHALGQPAIAAAIHAMGNSDPRLLNPLITTRQMFTLQYDAPALRARWAAAAPGEVDAATGSVAEPGAAAVTARTGLLRQLPAAAPTTTSTTSPGWLDGVEWFASPLDICRAQAALHALAKTPAGQPVAAILAKNPGVETGSGFAYVGYKGGSDAGVLTGSWYLQPVHGAATVLVVQLATADPTRIPDDAWYADALSGLITHLPR